MCYTMISLITLIPIPNYEFIFKFNFNFDDKMFVFYLDTLFIFKINLINDKLIFTILCYYP